MKWQRFFEIQGGGDSNSKEMAQFFGIKMAAAAIWNHSYLDVRCHWCVLNQSGNIPIKFADDWSNSKEIATVIQIFKMAATAILKFSNYVIPTSSICSKSKSQRSY